jgi:hypothetical protein
VPFESHDPDFSGWSKLVLLTDELAFLFPRDRTHAPYLTDKIEALQAVGVPGLGARTTATFPRCVGECGRPTKRRAASKTTW